MKYVFRYIKKIILGTFALYAFNMIGVNFNFIIPINLFTIVFIGIFELPALITLMIIKVWGL